MTPVTGLDQVYRSTLDTDTAVSGTFNFKCSFYVSTTPTPWDTTLVFPIDILTSTAPCDKMIDFTDQSKFVTLTLDIATDGTSSA